MNCNNCGKSIPEGSESCPYCGTTQNAVYEEYEEKRNSPFAVASFVVSMIGILIFAVICGPVSMVLAGMAFYNFDKYGDKFKGKGLMIAGFIIGIIDLVAGASALAADFSTARFFFWI